MYEELDERLQNSILHNVNQLEEHKDRVHSIFDTLGQEIDRLKGDREVFTRENRRGFSDKSCEDNRELGPLLEVTEEGK